MTVTKAHVARKPSDAHALRRGHDVPVRPGITGPPTLASAAPGAVQLQRKSSCACGGGCPRCTVQAKLEVGTPGDPYEQEADRVAEQVMRMPAPEAGIARPTAPQIQRLCSESQDERKRQPFAEGQEDRLQARADSSVMSVSPNIENAIRALSTCGQPLADSVRSYMELRFDTDFSGVRIHTGNHAHDLAQSVNAQAFTVGRNIIFGSGHYAPATTSGRRLIAHELTHVVQQTTSGVATIQRRCRVETPPADFDLESSGVWRQIRDGLDAITRPSSDPRQSPLPLYAPRQVLSILRRSNCFLTDAQTVDQNYPERAGRLPGIIIRLHQSEETGSHLIRREAPRVPLIEAEVTDELDRTVRNIVHEIVHATHDAPERAMRGARRVTRTEAAAIAEEATTRGRENDIMDEIYRAGGLAGASGRAASTEPNVIRQEFRSGRPRLTYQEHAIIGEMQTRYLSNVLPEARATSIAHAFVAQGQVAQVSRANLARFTVDAAFIMPHETRVGTPPIAPPRLSEARRCVDEYHHLSGTHLDRWREQASPACRELSRVLNTFSLARDPQTQRLTMDGEIELQRILRVRQGDYERAQALHDARQAVVALYRATLENNEQARSYFEWVLIAESMSAEWLALGEGASARQLSRLRDRHRGFLRGRLGGAMQGIPTP